MILLGEHPFSRTPEGRLRSRIATVFLRTPGLVTLPGIHATQRTAWIEELNRRRAAGGRPPLTAAEREAEWAESVDLILEEEQVLIRPDPGAMDLAFRADELLQETVSKRAIRFLYVTHARVRAALRVRGEYWRMCALPRTPEEMRTMLASARLALGGRAIYYYNRLTGTRYVTAAAFRSLGALDDAELRLHLAEIQTHGRRRNRFGSPEIGFFPGGTAFGEKDFADFEVAREDAAALRARHADLAARFLAVVPPGLREDNPDDLDWRNRMFGELLTGREEAVSEDMLRGLSPEFYMQIEWLPGGRIEAGELIFDPVFDELDRQPGQPELRWLCDLRARAFIFNYIREYGDIEYVNIGRISRSMSLRPAGEQTRHHVYIAQVKRPDRPEPVVHVLRVQKWGVPQRLDEGKTFFEAVMESEEYVDYVLDRRLGCRQLGMNLPPRVVPRRIQERYDGPARAYANFMHWLTYFERDYIEGRATDKLPPGAYADAAWAERLAVLLGAAAAPNLIVGCMRRDGTVLFDDGDEVVRLDAQGRPEEIVVADHTGTFTDYASPLTRFAGAYAQPVNTRAGLVADPARFAEVYVGALLERFRWIQAQARRQARAFRALFRYRPRDEKGSFAFRWERVLDRLEAANPAEVEEAVRAGLRR